MAALGSYLTSLPGSLPQAHANAVDTSSQSGAGGAAALQNGTDAAMLGSDGRTSDAGARTIITQQRSVGECTSIEDSSREPGDEVHMSGWQLHLQSAVPQQQLQRVHAITSFCEKE